MNKERFIDMVSVDFVVYIMLLLVDAFDSGIKGAILTACFWVPAIIIALILSIKWDFKKKCHHDWTVTEVSNIIQFDDMGYPLLLCIETCSKCGKSQQSWIDISNNLLTEKDYESLLLCKWRKKK